MTPSLPMRVAVAIAVPAPICVGATPLGVEMDIRLRNRGPSAHED